MTPFALSTLRDVRTWLRHWPTDQRLVALLSCRPHERWAQRSRVAKPTVTFRFDGRSQLLDAPDDWMDAIELSHDPLTDLDVVLAWTAQHDTPSSGWIGWISYELGRWIEPTVAQDRGARPGDWPLIELQWCPDVTEIPTATTPIGEPTSDASGTDIGPLKPDRPRETYEAHVAQVKNYIGAGDIFQANLTQQFTSAFAGSSRLFAETALSVAQPWYGAVIEDRDGRTVISLSPELFLALDPTTREIVSRPIKGTRPDHVDADELHDSEKDAAELHMITDLMRNDLGRVCAFGSMRVDVPRSIERHPTVHHGVSEIAGQLRDGVTRGEVLQATFPPGSITGAPKIRAMQIIEELEPRPRGPYCGAIGWFGDDGGMMLNVAIRTIMIADGTMTYGAGGGIVADSDPRAEYEESIQKAEVLIRAMERMRDSD